ncbi:MAG: Gfo/Idh/MocA family oxidoreductase [Acidobacteriia bacterium]|nr:Gfo/Idh/MocA family oxidoreductase [Terriglobia bacterium]
MSSNTPLRGAIIGAGFFAAFQADAWRRMDSARIVAVADGLPGRAQEFAAQWDIPRAYRNAEEMLDKEKLDFVDIVTRPSTHLALTRLGAAHKLHVICQKPMAPTIEECMLMLAACESAGVRLLIHENWRWQPWYREARRILDSGSLGNLFYAGFHLRSGDGLGPEPYKAQPYFREMPMLLMYEMGIHFIDTFRYLVDEIAALRCRMRKVNPIIAGEDCAVIELSFRNGVQGAFDANRISGPAPPPVAFGHMRLEGDRGMLRMTPYGKLFLTEYGQPEQEHMFHAPAVDNKGGYKGDSILALQTHLIEGLRTGAACESDAAAYLPSVRAVFACYDSSRTGQVVYLD